MLTKVVTSVHVGDKEVESERIYESILRDGISSIQSLKIYNGEGCTDTRVGASTAGQVNIDHSLYQPQHSYRFGNK